MRVQERRLRALVCCFAVFCFGASAQEPTPPTPAAVDAVFAEYDSTRSPGCALGVMEGGVMAYARGYGMANLEYAVAITPRSVFRIGSTSKQFTAMAIALLAEEGKLSLDDDVRKYQPELQPHDPPVTVRHLVHHTSGLRDYLTLADLAGFGNDYSIEQALDLLARQKALNFPAGTRHLYSNSGYFLMSQIVERAAGESLAAWAAKHVFAPLGMKHSHFQDDTNRIVENRADGYAPSGDGFAISMTTLDIVGDGGVFTTVEDLLRWDRNFYDNRLGSGGPALIERVLTPGTLADGEVLDYAFGLVVGEHRGLKTVRHGGAFVGFRAQMIRFPEQRLSVAVLCNLATTQPSRLAVEVAELYLADEMEPEPTAAAEGGEGPASLAEVPADDLARVSGSYWMEEARAVRTLRVEDGKLLYDRGGSRTSELAPLGGDRFRMLGVGVAVEISFEPAGSPRPRKMVTVIGGGEPSEAEYFEQAATSAEGLERYAGGFSCDELGVAYTLAVEGEELVVGMPRGGRHPFERQLGEIFTSAETGVVLEFEIGRRGKVNGFTLDAGRVRNLRFVRQ